MAKDYVTFDMYCMEWDMAKKYVNKYQIKNIKDFLKVRVDLMMM